MLPGDLTCLQKAIYCVKAPTTQLQSCMHPLYGCNASCLPALMLLYCTTAQKSNQLMGVCKCHSVVREREREFLY